ncbi:hypothetical protein TNIN_223581 [Trichonephila inaurata madagascariensis]|uniref:Uncharacterized protein n=1 Tax=Trichonephila inaurata madagascariensis TaxID=2747483 RepID=A0A8X6MGW3_9ARAC|nr:hypothetical protein TNIN_223581 [Trichonephila inaurata madagascariensis]
MGIYIKSVRLDGRAFATRYYHKTETEKRAVNTLQQRIVKTCRLSVNDKWICYKHPPCDEKMEEMVTAVNSFPSVQGSYSEPGPTEAEN